MSVGLSGSTGAGAALDGGGHVAADRAAEALHLGLALLYRRLRQIPVQGELSLPEAAALRRLDRHGPATVTGMARGEQISVQSMGATLAGLESKAMVERRPDPADGRRSVLSVTEVGHEALGLRRHARTRYLAERMSGAFDEEELQVLLAAAPLLERLAEQL